ncbi:low molecular weight phosphotyrosine protein phosphatase [Nocardioides dongxiaopingii]|uniref:low molecular weight protein-tyrosine-phosphatase n=1 Tax=Nocardioides sp. S-1144 TaxID=2582905 RepID=UPI00110D8005|nr:low molecular weight protein-tyrosine-phosphatase [Nocardioides sp. S-1144]QCW52163.1 low molecular weight phosphotyrosine protein phosphatase [Nocardioides sp. S-1144]
MSLPPPREAGRYRIGVVCLGNICRSPMAHVVLEARVAAAGLADEVTVTSSGTGGWHVGDPMDPRAAATLAAAGHDGSRHRARQFATSWHDEHDLLLAMDAANLADIGGGTDRVRLFRSFDPEEPGADVPDPYYGGDRGFQEVLAMVERCSEAIVSELATSLPTSLPSSPDR